jgi:hypothetical protein
VDLHITIDGKTFQNKKQRHETSSMFVHGSVRDTTDRPVTMLVPQSESGDLESVVDVSCHQMSAGTNYSSEDEDAMI